MDQAVTNFANYLFCVDLPLRGALQVRDSRIRPYQTFKPLLSDRMVDSPQIGFNFLPVE